MSAKGLRKVSNDMAYEQDLEDSAHAGFEQAEEEAYVPPAWNQTQDAIARLEELTKSRVIVYWVHPRSGITEEDAEILYNHLQLIGRQEKITLVITAPGGTGPAALRIARLLRSYCDTFEVMVPHRAASSATVLALAGDRIVMTPLGALSPIDNSLQHALNPTNENGSVPIELQEIQHFLRLVRRESNQGQDVQVYPVNPVELLSKYVHPVVLGAMERSSSYSKRLASDVLRLHEKDEGKIARIVGALTDNYPAHDYPISVEEAQRLGISATTADEELEQVLWDIEGGMKQCMFRAVSAVADGQRETSANLISIETLGCRSFLGLHECEQLADDGSWVAKGSELTWFTVIPDPDNEGNFCLDSLLI